MKLSQIETTKTTTNDDTNISSSSSEDEDPPIPSPIQRVKWHYVHEHSSLKKTKARTPTANVKMPRHRVLSKSHSEPQLTMSPLAEYSPYFPEDDDDDDDDDNNNNNNDVININSDDLSPLNLNYCSLSTQFSSEDNNSNILS